MYTIEITEKNLRTGPIVVKSAVKKMQEAPVIMQFAWWQEFFLSILYSVSFRRQKNTGSAAHALGDKTVECIILRPLYVCVFHDLMRI